MCIRDRTYSLKVFLDPRGIRDKYYWEGARAVMYLTKPVKESSSPSYRCGISCPPEQISPWWTPSEGGHALFRASGGVLVDSTEDVNPGDYFLVVNDLRAIPKDLTQDSPVPLEVDRLDEPVWDYWVCLLYTSRCV